jgi:[acyl-carrier-protein] S-malonyltransferase
MGLMTVFPGQGSQQPGMGRFLFDNFILVKHLFEEASEAISVDLKKLCFNSSDSDLALTENTQPALLLVSNSTFQVLKNEFGFSPKLSAGHSIGEYAALVGANVLPFSTAMKAVRLRGQAMQSAVPIGQGGMAAVMGLDSQQAKEVCEFAVKKTGLGPVSPANFNAPGQIVISGSQKTLSWMYENLKAEDVWPESTTAPKRIKFIPLQVSAPFHCSLMKPAEEKMADFFENVTFNKPNFPILQNFTAQIESDPLRLKTNLVKQVTGSVLWMQSMETAKTNGFNNVVECGAGTVIKGLLKKIDAEYFKVFNTNNLEEIKLIEESIKNGNLI